MEFKIAKETFYGALLKIQGIAGRKATLPITSNVLLAATDSSISLQATDLSISFHGTYDATITESGSTLVPSRKLFEIIKDFPYDTIHIKEISNKWIEIKGPSVRYTMVGMEAEEFPAFPDIDQIELASIESSNLKDIISKTIAGVVGDEKRAYLAGSYLETHDETDGKKLRIVALDGHRLLRADVVMEQNSPFSCAGIIIPKNGLIEILRMLEDGTVTSFGVSNQMLIVKSNNEGIVIRLIDGQFPKYELMIPQNITNVLKVKKDEFLMMLKRMSIFSSEACRTMKFTITGGTVEAAISNPELGESREKIDCIFDGEDFRVACNPKYVVEALGLMTSDEITIKFSGGKTPFLIEGSSDQGFLSVVMPIEV